MGAKGAGAREGLGPRPWLRRSGEAVKALHSTYCMGDPAGCPLKEQSWLQRGLDKIHPASCGWQLGRHAALGNSCYFPALALLQD